MKESQAPNPWRTVRRLVAGSIGIALLLAAIPASAQAPRKFTLAVIPGAQDFIVSVMDQQHLFQKVKLEPQFQKLLSPAAMHPLMVEGKVDVGFGGFATMAIARSQGRPVLVVGAMFSPTNFVLVRKDFPAQSLADLKGKKLGLFGGPGAATSSILFVIAKRWHGVDLSREAQLVTAPNPALAGLLDNKELDAALFGTTESLKLALTGRYRILADLSEEWERHGGRAPAHVTIATTEPFARAHPDILRDFLRGYREGVRFIREHPEVWEGYGRRVDIITKEGIALLHERIGPRIVDAWDQKQMEVQTHFLEAMIETMGDKFLKAIPVGLMTDAYNP